MATTAPKTTGATKRDLLDLCKKQGVSFLRLQFTDILGLNKNVEVPESQFEKALEGDVMFDGSSIEGFVRIEESDMVLKPDLETFRILPYDDEGGRVARLICDIYNPDGSSFAGCTRQALKRQIAAAQTQGYELMAGVEAEFFIFQLDHSGEPTTETHDHGGYFDLTPVDRAEEIRRLIIRDLVSMGFEVEAGITRWRRDSTRSISATPRRSRPPTTWRRSASSCATWRSGTGSSPPSCRSRSSGRMAPGCTRTSRCSRT